MGGTQSIGNAHERVSSSYTSLLHAVERLNLGFEVLSLEGTVELRMAATDVANHRILSRKTTPRMPLRALLLAEGLGGPWKLKPRRKKLNFVVKLKGATAAEMLHAAGRPPIPASVTKCAVVLGVHELGEMHGLVQSLIKALTRGSMMTFDGGPGADCDLLPSEDECPVCMDRDCDLVLPCGHAFCALCVQDWAAQEGRGETKGDDNEQLTMLSCPCCRQDVTTPTAFMDERRRALSLEVARPSLFAGMLTQCMSDATDFLHGPADGGAATDECWQLETFDQKDLETLMAKTRSSILRILRAALSACEEPAALVIDRTVRVTGAPDWEQHGLPQMRA